MWPFKRNLRRRRLEVRKHIPAQRLSRWRRFRQAGGLGSILLALAFCLAVIALDTSVNPTDRYRPGQYVPEDIHARLNFMAKRSPEQAREFTPAVFRFNQAVAQRVVEALAKLAETDEPDATQPEKPERDRKLIEQLSLDDAEELAALRGRIEQMSPQEFGDDVERLAAVLAEVPAVRSEQAASQRSRPANEVLLAVPDKGRDRRNIQDLIVLEDPLQLRRRLNQALTETQLFDPTVRGDIVRLTARLLPKLGPLYEYDSEATETRISNSVEWVRTRRAEQLPAYLREQHLAGEVLAHATVPTPAEPARKTGLLPGEIDLLEAEAAAYAQQEQIHAPWNPIARRVGRAGIVVALVALLAAYVTRYYPRIVENHWRGVSILLLVLLMLLAVRLTVHGLGWDPNTAVFAVLVVATIAALVYDQRFALALATATCLLLVVLLRAPIDLLLVLLAALVVAVLQLADVRTRTKLIRVAATAGATLLAGVWLLGWARNVPWAFILPASLWGLASAVIVGFLLQGLLPIIERVYRFATSMTLLEWCDASKPLLKRLAMEAPGTYNHSLQLGAMCEAAAESIGARGLVARVGAYYHDIGKIHKPTYFIENQADGDSKHAKLSPAMSLLIIIGHVKDGLELAREYGLPRVLHEFIATHHGTTLVQYFYRAATEQRKDKGTDRAPEEVEFRYPGPKPASREAAILMLADAAESSVRSMSDPTPGRIENQVHTMVTRRMTDGQLDVCNLTLREVHEIEASLVRSLCSFYHARIAYPTPEGQKPSAAEKHPRGTRQPQPEKGQEGSAPERAVHGARS